RNIMIPPSPTSPKQKGHSEKPINPITGQYLDDEAPSLSDMTDEEKEREAERLFVLFERLKKTGVMNVVNPVEEAAKSGKLNENLNNQKPTVIFHEKKIRRVGPVFDEVWRSHLALYCQNVPEDIRYWTNKLAEENNSHKRFSITSYFTT
ncbi:7885_t:CDS:2, partial [Racocetra persica]